MTQRLFAQHPVWACLALSASAAAAQAQPSPFATFTPIGGLAANPVASFAERVSDDGRTLVGRSAVRAGFEAFRWTDPAQAGEGIRGLGEFPGGPFFSAAICLSQNGARVFGQSNDGAFPFAFVWNDPAAGGTGLLSRPPGFPGGLVQSNVLGCTADGSVAVGQVTTSLGLFASFIWTAPGTVQTPIPGTPASAFFSFANAITPDGRFITGSFSTGAAIDVYRYRRGGMGVQPMFQTLGDLPGGIRNGAAADISADGLVIVGRGTSDNGTEAYRWSDPAAGGVGFQALGDLPGGAFASDATAVSADGTRIVGLAEAPDGTRAFLWQPLTGMLDLNTYLGNLGVDLRGYTLITASDISADGSVIVGTALRPDGNPEAFLVTLPINGCLVADLAPDWGTLDINDILIFAQGFGTDASSDLFADGTFDINDVLILATSLAQSCLPPLPED